MLGDQPLVGPVHLIVHCVAGVAGVAQVSAAGAGGGGGEQGSAAPVVVIQAVVRIRDLDLRTARGAGR